MYKRIISILIAVCLVFASACASATAPESQGYNETYFNVTFTLPADLIDSEYLEGLDPLEFAKSAGIKKAVLNEDGSMTVTMSKRQYKKWVASFTESIEESFTELCNSSESAYIKAITHNADFTEIAAEVDDTAYSGFSFLLDTIQIVFLCTFYNAFTGAEDVNIVVSAVSIETGEILNTFDTAELAG